MADGKTKTTSFHDDVKDLKEDTQTDKGETIAGKPYVRGRKPIKFCEELCDEICDRMIEGESLREIAKEERMPSMGTMMRWVGDSERFAEQYARARAMQAETYASQIIEIAEDGTNDWMEKRNKDGEVIGWTVNGEAVQRSKLRIDARKWIMSKILPKRYGEKVEIEHKGEVKTVAELEPGERRQLARALLTARENAAKEVADHDQGVEEDSE